MNKGILSYVFSKFKRNKENIIFVLLYVICFLILFLALSFKTNFEKFTYDQILIDETLRTIFVMPKSNEDRDLDVNAIKNVSHVILVDPYMLGVSAKIKMDNSKYTNDLVIKYIYEDVNNNLGGQKLKKDDEGLMICPENFYPSSIPDDLLKNPIDKNDFLGIKDTLNKTFTFEFDRFERDEYDKLKITKFNKEFKIVGHHNLNTSFCYVSEKDMKNILKIHNEKDANSSSNGIASMEVLVDKIENIKPVVNELKNMGYNALGNGSAIESNLSLIVIIKTICYFITFVVIVITTLITIFYIKKRNINNTYEMGLLKSLGYSNKHIQQIYSLSLLMVSIISVLFGLIIFNITILFLKSKYYSFLIFLHINLIFPLVDLIMALLVMLVVPLIVNYYLNHKKLKLNINYLLKGEKL